MSLPLNSRIGAYEVVAKVGEGGMGEVYRGRDSKLARDVALKVLPDAFAQDAERLARFEREAKTLASLNHPHIAHVYGFEHSGATQALVMEFVDGEDLAARIRRGPIPLDEALPIARQIAEALEAAHDAGIVHRDLKPANVKVTADGTVKVLDFGLAKAFEPGSGIGDPGSGALANSPTITSPAMTMRGVILGTAAYMAPEQAKGKYVDKRADIWAFGCVLYEMITGKRAFDGEDVSDTLASVLRAEPDFAALSKHSTPAVSGIIRRCLQRDPRQRIRDAGDVRIRLDDAPSAIAGVPPTTASRPAWWAVAVAGAAAAVILAGGMPMLFRERLLPETPVLRFSLRVPNGMTVNRAILDRMQFAVSPDGRKIAAVLRNASMGRRLFVAHLDGSEFREVPGTEGATTVFWAPDSDRLAYATQDGMAFTSLSNNTAIPIVKLPGYGPMVWSSDDRMIIATGPQQPWQRWSFGQTAAADAGLPDGVNASAPMDLLPDGLGVLAVRQLSGSTNELQVVAQAPDGLARELARVQGNGPPTVTSLVRSGHLLLTTNGAAGDLDLTARRLDLSTMNLSGDRVVLASGVTSQFTASQNGILAYAHGGLATEELVWVDDRGGVAAPVMPRARLTNFDLSKDDRMIAIQEPEGLRVHDLQRGVTTVLAAGSGVDPVWSPDGREVAYAISAAPDRGVYVMPAFGGPARRIYTRDVATYLDDWSRDGKWLAAHSNLPNDGLLIPLDPALEPIPFGSATAKSAVDEGRFSPDANWLAYGLTSAEGGDVFLMPVPPTGPRWQVSVSGGAQPRWSGDGRSLFFLAPDGLLMKVDVDAKPGAIPNLSAPRALFQTGIRVVLNLDQFAVSRDGTRFLLRRPESGAATEDIRVIVNWPALLKGDSK